MIAELEDLFNEVRLTMHALVQSFEKLHEGKDISLSMRAVLEFLSKEGPSTVPEIARSRHVSRQHIQLLANSLIELGMVHEIDNPAHKKSKQLSLTQLGVRNFSRMKEAELDSLKKANWKVSAQQLKSSSQVLKKIREVLLNEIP